MVSSILFFGEKSALLTVSSPLVDISKGEKSWRKAILLVI